MTERTVTVEVTEAKEEPVYLCDYCGLGDDVEDEYGELVEFKAYGSDEPNLHYHEKCRERATLGETQAPLSWHEMADVGGRRILFAFARVEFVVMLLGVVLIALAPLAGGWGWGLVAAAIGAGFIITAAVSAWRQAAKPSDRLQLLDD